jgi:hypothetical protein
MLLMRVFLILALSISPVWAAVDFDGTGDYLNCTDNTAFDNDNDMSCCAWVWHDSLTGDHYIAAKRTSAAGGFLFIRDESGSVSGRTDTYTIFVSDGGGDSCRVEGATNASKTGQWMHVCWTFSSVTNEVNLYVNGIIDPNSPGDCSIVNNLGNNNTPLYIGANQDASGSWFNGKMAQFHCDEKELSSQDIASLYSFDKDSALDITQTKFLNYPMDDRVHGTAANGLTIHNDVDSAEGADCTAVNGTFVDEEGGPSD